ncbi:MAG: J domain-containing protein [SAR202 cluster bacterium]|nr:J domain-containing protein [SAR202 cluster bacterium]|tara:strand:- start:858 stop:1742 length:885 start_codon:yes stop_codon:yes gene_type:complete
MATRQSDYYGVLGVSRNSTEEEIQKAYRKLARKYHPDLNQGDKSSEKKFKEINEAYEVLGDKNSRQKYNLYGENWNKINQNHSDFNWSNFGFGNDKRSTGNDFRNFNDIFSNINHGFKNSSSRKKQNIQNEINISISLEESFQGTVRKLNLNYSRNIEVKIPAGVDTGSVVKIKPSKDRIILIKIEVLPNPKFSRNGLDLFSEISVPLLDCILGGKTSIDTLDNSIDLKIPPKTQNGQKIKLSGLGMPKVGDFSKRGDFFAVIRPVLPNELTDKEEKFYSNLRDLHRDSGINNE